MIRVVRLVPFPVVVVAAAVAAAVANDLVEVAGVSGHTLPPCG